MEKYSVTESCIVKIVKKKYKYKNKHENNTTGN